MSKDIEALKLLRKELVAIKEKYQKKYTKELDKHNKKLQEFKEDYPTTTAIDEAYGCGAITSKKRDKLYDMFENFEKLKNYDSVTGHVIVMLEHDIKQIDLEIQIEERK